MSYLNPETWLIDEGKEELLPSDFLNLTIKPQRVIFLAVEGQSTDDGKVFVNLFRDVTIKFHVVNVNEEKSNLFFEKFKDYVSNKNFKDVCIDKESEHGLALWKNESGNYSLAYFVTNDMEFDQTLVDGLEEIKLSKKSKLKM